MSANRFDATTTSSESGERTIRAVKRVDEHTLVPDGRELGGQLGGDLVPEHVAEAGRVRLRRARQDPASLRRALEREPQDPLARRRA